jgi:hypothetical protein
MAFIEGGRVTRKAGEWLSKPADVFPHKLKD